jgi:hypothetical protein
MAKLEELVSRLNSVSNSFVYGIKESNLMNNIVYAKSSLNSPDSFRVDSDGFSFSNNILPIVIDDEELDLLTETKFLLSL